MAKNPPANVGGVDLTLNQKDPLEQKRATHANIHAWIFPWTEEPGGLQSTGSQRLDTTE